MARSSASGRKSHAGTAPRPRGVVLLVEDEPSVRRVTLRMLESRGYPVLLAETPDEAMQIAAAHAGAIDLLLSDVQLPGLDGPELARRLREQRPGLKVVFISGYTREEAIANAPDDPTCEFLQKPFTPKQLEDMLARILAAPESTVEPVRSKSAGGTAPAPSKLDP